jgi:hypothetical protein
MVEKDYYLKIGDRYIVAGKEKALKTDDKPQAFTLEIVPWKISLERATNRKLTE